MTAAAVARDFAAASGTRDLAPLSAAAGLVLDTYRPAHVAEALRRTLERERLPGTAELVRLLGRDPCARTRFRRSVAVSFSGFVRDPEQFRLLEREVLPRLLERPGRFGVWSAGCADGSELYSVALVLERLGAVERSLLVGSDVLAENVELARAAVYPGVHIPTHLRRRVRWEQRDLAAHRAPTPGWRLILCRNVGIYFSARAQHELHAQLAGSLANGGVLLLGRSERISDPAAIGLRSVAPHAYERTLAGR